VDHYYLLEELYSVAGLAASNGMLEEAVVYDTYGQAAPTSQNCLAPNAWHERRLEAPLAATGY
jgi:hypothetical protein